MINLIFTPVDESLPELIEFSSSYAGAWKSDWVYIITKSGEIESARLSVSGNKPKPVGQDIREGGKWESCLHDHPPLHKMVKYSPVIGWAYTSDIRELASAPKAAPGDVLDEALRERDDAEDFIDALLDEVLGHERPEWSSSYGRADALNDVQERMTAVDKAWGRFQSAMAAPQQEAQEPALFVSAKQLADLVDPSHATGGSYLPARKTRAGLFTQPLYTAPQPAPAPLSDDTKRLNWLLWKLPGNALRYVVGELSDTSSGSEFRAAIDAAIAAQGDKA